MYYKTYAEAKIANPDCEVVTTGLKWNGEKSLVGSFAAATIESFGDFPLGSGAWVFCNPADHCSTLKKFLEAGFKLVVGDKIITIGGEILEIKDKNTGYNDSCKDDHKRYILSASTLNGGRKIPSKAEQWTVYNNTLPLCELADEQAAMLFNAWRGGAVRQALNNSGFCDLPAKATLWFESLAYRIKPNSERELFIENSSMIMHSVEGDGLINDITLGALYDNGARYKDLTQHFGENI